MTVQGLTSYFLAIMCYCFEYVGISSVLLLVLQVYNKLLFKLYFLGDGSLCPNRTAKGKNHGAQINKTRRCAQTAQQRGKTMEHKSTKPAAVPKPHSEEEKPWRTNQANSLPVPKQYLKASRGNKTTRLTAPKQPAVFHHSTHILQFTLSEYPPGTRS